MNPSLNFPSPLTLRKMPALISGYVRDLEGCRDYSRVQLIVDGLEPADKARIFQACGPDLRRRLCEMRDQAGASSLADMHARWLSEVLATVKTPDHWAIATDDKPKKIISAALAQLTPEVQRRIEQMLSTSTGYSAASPQPTEGRGPGNGDRYQGRVLHPGRLRNCAPGNVGGDDHELQQ